MTAMFERQSRSTILSTSVFSFNLSQSRTRVLITRMVRLLIRNTARFSLVFLKLRLIPNRPLFQEFYITGLN